MHRFVDRSKYDGTFMPGFVDVEHDGEEEMLVAIDHIVGNVELGAMQDWVSYYERVFGMTEMIHFSDEAISTEYSALMSKVVTNGSGRVKFPINEPAEGKRKSQIDEYLDFYEGAGAQHIALATRDIVGVVEQLKKRGVKFLKTPESYYDEVPGRVGEIAGGPRGPAQARHPRGLRRRGLPAADLHEAARRPADDLLRDHRAPWRPRLRGGKLQGVVRGDRARAGREGESVAMRYVRMGELPPKRHTQVRGDDGRLLTEEVMGYEGFSGNESILLHLESPCRAAGGRRVHAADARGVGARTRTSTG